MMKRTRNMTMLLLACGLLTTAVVPAAWPAAAFAAATQPAISKEAAVAKARAVFELTEEEWKLSTSELRNGQDPFNPAIRSSWQLHFSFVQNEMYRGVSVVLDSQTGHILQMNHNNKGETCKCVISREEAQAVSEAFLKQAAPELMNQIRSTEQGPDRFGSYAHSFNYERLSPDGIPVLGDMVQVSVGQDGMIQAYSRQWTPTELPAAAKPSLDMAAAVKRYAESVDMRLSYYDSYRAPKPEMILGYAPSYLPTYSGYYGMPLTYPLIDAVDGKMLGSDGLERKTINRPADKPLVENGPVAPTSRSTPFTEEEILAHIDALGILPQGATLHSTSLHENGPQKIWNLRFLLTDPTGIKPEMNLTFDALTGELINFGSWLDALPKPTSPLLKTELEAKAIEWMKKLYPQRTGMLKQPDMPTLPPDSPQATFVFPLLKNGIPTTRNISLSLNTSTGEVVGVFGDLSMIDSNKTTIPSPDGVIGTDKAEELYMKQRPLRLSYLFPTTKDGRSTTPQLVYTPEPLWSDTNVIEAKTGEWLNLTTLKQPKPPEMPSDIIGHWAEKPLAKYALLGHLQVVDGKAHPDRAMSRAQVIRLLVNVTNPKAAVPKNATFTDVPQEHAAYPQIEAAADRGWIMKDAHFRPDDAITREEFATIVARALGHQELIKQRDLFRLPFADQDQISHYAYGAVAVDYGLGLMKGADNRFRPKQNITLAELVTILDRMPQIR